MLGWDGVIQSKLLQNIHYVQPSWAELGSGAVFILLIFHPPSTLEQTFTEDLHAEMFWKNTENELT